MDEFTRRKLCRLIAGVVVVDDDLDPAEDAFINNLLKKFELGSEERDALFPIMDGDEAARELMTFPEAVRGEAFGILVEAAAADKKYATEERVFLERVAEVIGVPKAELDKMMEKALAG
ncbi:MAG: TerB family tellurite resistance protein [Deltaproteobacteria bacterium]|nr:TerB family tellurite resistance protein [Deltaproteobacteria bacterium]